MAGETSNFEQDISTLKVDVAKLTVMQQVQMQETKGLKTLFIACVSGVWALFIAFVTAWLTVHFTGRP